MAKHTWHTTLGHGRDLDLGLLLSCYSSGDRHNLQDSQSLILKILKLLKYLRGCFVARSMLWKVKGKEWTDAPSHVSENERQSEPEAIFSEDTWIGWLVTASSLARWYAFWRAKPKTLHLKMSARSFYQTRSQHCQPLVPPYGRPHTSTGSNVTSALQKKISKEKGAPRCESSSPWTQLTLLYFLSSFQRKETFNTQNLHYYSPYTLTLSGRLLRIVYHTSQFCSEGLKQETPFQMKWRIIQTKPIFNFLFTAAVANKFL